uniref:Uncharacterized protein n=1 Tax=Oryza sativa subsp. japonica TaxID=39947 RepID=Q2QS07_ORYSJ|nr:hypothetical protein LOC_Os12g25750 [Oryza sativa Japonica Group]
MTISGHITNTSLVKLYQIRMMPAARMPQVVLADRRWRVCDRGRVSPMGRRTQSSALSEMQDGDQDWRRRCMDEADSVKPDIRRANDMGCTAQFGSRSGRVV